MSSNLYKIIRSLYFRILSIIHYIYQYYILFKWIRHKQNKTIIRIQNKEKITVVFFAMNLPMWRYQGLYDELLKYSAFEVYLVLSPCKTFSLEQQRLDIEKLRSYFKSKSVTYIDYNFINDAVYDVRNKLNPDLLFYPQPYSHLLVKEHDSTSFYDKLICYYPYAFWTAYSTWSYDEPFHNVAWKLYYSTELHKRDAIEIAHNKGRNVVIVGYPNSDNFLNTQSKDVWKKQSIRKKRIIWAPHFTISEERSFVVHSNFLWMADFMLEVAQKYSEQIQFAFKPHPRLLTELYVHPDWGQARTNSYYQIWKDLENGQFENGEFKDLFMTSDGMIHDCSSFTVEYHYCLKPVMYIQGNLKTYADTLSEFGKLALEAHYLGKNKEDIINFIEKVILGGEDTMFETRKLFYDKYLLPPNGKTVVENTLDDLLKSLKKK